MNIALVQACYRATRCQERLRRLREDVSVSRLELLYQKLGNRCLLLSISQRAASYLNQSLFLRERAIFLTSFQSLYPLLSIRTRIRPRRTMRQLYTSQIRCFYPKRSPIYTRYTGFWSTMAIKAIYLLHLSLNVRR